MVVSGDCCWQGGHQGEAPFSISCRAGSTYGWFAYLGCVACVRNQRRIRHWPQNFSSLNTLPTRIKLHIGKTTAKREFLKNLKVFNIRIYFAAEKARFDNRSMVFQFMSLWVWGVWVKIFSWVQDYTSICCYPKSCCYGRTILSSAWPGGSILIRSCAKRSGNASTTKDISLCNYCVYRVFHRFMTCKHAKIDLNVWRWQWGMLILLLVGCEWHPAQWWNTDNIDRLNKCYLQLLYNRGKQTRRPQWTWLYAKIHD